MFSNSLERFGVLYTLLPGEEQLENLTRIENSLQIASRRLKSNVDLCCLALCLPLQQKRDELRFYGFFLVGGYLVDARLEGVGFYGAQMTGVPFYGADLSNAGFTDAEMKGVGFASANLSNAWLNRANLQHAGFRGANLVGAILVGAKLRWAKLPNARIDDSTNLKNANWWQANFFLSPLKEDEYNAALLEVLYQRYGQAIPSDPNEVDLSV